jgi:hypothetical protein
VALLRRRSLAQVIQFERVRDDIVGAARLAGSGQLPEVICRTRHWSRSSRTISSFASL